MGVNPGCFAYSSYPLTSSLFWIHCFNAHIFNNPRKSSGSKKPCNPFSKPPGVNVCCPQFSHNSPYSSTLNLPKIDFPLNADITERERVIQRYWETENIYKRLLNAKDRGPPFIIHDGPPYANGNIHMGHALNKLLKDFINRYQLLKGRKAIFVPGWDCHGLPIESQALKAIQEASIGSLSKGTSAATSSQKSFSPSSSKPQAALSLTEILSLRRAAYKHANEHKNRQLAAFKRLGVWALWDSPYRTYTYEYQHAELEIFRSLFRQSAYIAWEITGELPDSLLSPFHSHGVSFPLRLHLLTWTTAPWTVPANQAIAVNTSAEYLLLNYTDICFRYKKSQQMLEKDVSTQISNLKDFAVFLNSSKSFSSSNYSNLSFSFHGNQSIPSSTNISCPFKEREESAAASLEDVLLPPITPSCTSISSSLSPTSSSSPPVEYLLIAKEAADEVLRTLFSWKLSPFRISPVATLKGESLLSLRYIHPFNASYHGFLLPFPDFVSPTEGSGFLHIAPGHGPEDFLLAQRWNLSIVSPVDEFGCYTNSVLDDRLKGLNVLKEGNSAVLQILKEKGCLLKTLPFKHSYPYDIRSNTPTLYRTTSQWFIKTNFLRETAMKLLESIQWTPSSALHRQRLYLKNRPEWCISRQRYWGVPLPIFYNIKTKESLLNEDSIHKCLHQLAFLKKNGDEAETMEPLMALDEQRETNYELKNKEIKGNIFVRRKNKEEMFMEQNTKKNEEEAQKFQKKNVQQNYSQGNPHEFSGKNASSKEITLSAASLWKIPSFSHFNQKWRSDILDVWFDSACSWSVLYTHPTLKHYFASPFPSNLKNERNSTLPMPLADLYCEGHDQLRGWFQASLLTSIATFGKSPFKHILVHGFVLDEKGLKMSKSKGNILSPMGLLGEDSQISSVSSSRFYSVDMLRLWAASVDYTEDVLIGHSILKEMKEMYRKIRTIFRFLLGNLYDFDPSKDSVAYTSLPSLDKWILGELTEVSQAVDSAFEMFAFPTALQSLRLYITKILSSFYLDISKDRLYISEPRALRRRACQTVLYIHLKVLTLMFSPFLPHLMEDVWMNFPKILHSDRGEKFKNSSLFEQEWPSLVFPSHESQRWDTVRTLRSNFHRLMESPRADGVLRSLNEVSAFLFIEDSSVKQLIQPLVQSEVPLTYSMPSSEEVCSTVDNLQCALSLARIYLVDSKEAVVANCKEFHSSDKISKSKIFFGIRKAHGKKCKRCWLVCDSVGSVDQTMDLCSRCASIVSRLPH